MSKGLSSPLQNESPNGDASQSALFYLFQEVSKLASPLHSSFTETDFMWFDSEEDKSQSLHCSLPPQMTNVQSPLKLLNLIDQQCEKLLKQNENEDEEQGHGPLLISDFGNSNVSLANPTVEQFLDSAQPFNPERHLKKCDSQLKECNREDAAICPVKTTVTKNTDPVHPEKKRGTAGAPQTSKLKFSVALNLSRDWTDECLSTQSTFYDFLPDPHHNEHSSDAHLTFRSNDTEQSFSLDCNANISLNPGKTLNDPLESAHSEFCRSSNSLQQLPSDVQGNTASTCEDSSDEIPKPRAENSLTHSLSLEKDDCVHCTVQRSTWRSKSRKQPRPSRSASVQDPDFQGVTFRMDTELDDSKDQCRLLITSKYSTDLPKNVKRTRLRTRAYQRCLKTSSDEDSDSATSDTKSKTCASCSTSKTPMWRDAEDGTPLCNACGIRYKKYRVRCTNCWHIPKKEGNSVSRCSKCGHFVRLSSAQRRPII